MKAILRRMLRMCPEAWYIFITSIKLSCFLCLCSFALLLQWNGSMSESYELYMTALSLNEISQSVLLLGVIISACAEGIQS